MTELQASRTLVKSPPELWAECSDAASLARHLGRFGEIRITRLDPETAVAWEGERARGTVRIEPAGWGTKVILTAEPVGDEPSLAGAGGARRVVRVPATDPTDQSGDAGATEARGDAGATESPPVVGATEPPPVVGATEPPGDAGATGLSDATQPAEAPAASATPRRRRRFSRFFTFRRGPGASPELEAPAQPAVAGLAEPSPASETPHVTEAARVSEAARVTEAARVPEVPQVPEHVPEAIHAAPAPAPANESPRVAADAEAALTAALDSLGQAHHRPFSRA
jgi:hypothetical protein